MAFPAAPSLIGKRSELWYNNKNWAGPHAPSGVIWNEVLHRMDLTEKTLDSQVLYDGKIVRLRRDTALLPNGSQALREVVEHPGGVGIVALDADGTVLLVRQYRYPLGKALLEIPAGKLERGEDHREAAVRELSEEVGAQAGKLTYLGYTYASPGFCDEAIHLYLAEELTFGETHPDEDEFLMVERLPLDKLVAMALDGTLTDGKSVSGVLKTALLRKGV